MRRSRKPATVEELTEEAQAFSHGIFRQMAAELLLGYPGRRLRDQPTGAPLAEQPDEGD